MAPRTAAERKKKQRESMSAEKKAAENDAAKARMKAIREFKQKNPPSAKEIKQNRLETKLRVQAWRRRRKAEVDPRNHMDCEGAYSSRQSLGKAVKRATANLPTSPRKKKAVVKKLATTFGVLEQPNCLPKSCENRPNQGIPATTKEAAKAFYIRDDISRQDPSKKNVVTIRYPNGTKEHKVKRFLMYYLKETHQMFLEQNKDNMQIGLSTFCELRPQEVMLLSDKDQTVCCCPYCENLEFLIASLNWTDRPSSIRDLAKQVVCNDSSEDCMKNRCPVCTNILLTYLENNIPQQANETIKFHQWDGGHLIDYDISLEEFIEKLEGQLTRYKKHLFNIRHQANALRVKKETLQEGEVILLTDFAENFNVKHQNEVMAAHWKTSSDASVTIYTAVVYFKKDGELKTRSFAIISDTKAHGSLEVAVFNDIILNNLKVEIKVDHVDLWTDGAAQHFKNSKSMVVLSLSEVAHWKWNFQESYHGKGPHDGIGAACKHNVWRRILQGRVVVKTAKDFHKAASEAALSVTCLYVSLDMIDTQKEKYNALWEGCKQARGILAARYVVPVGPFKIKLYENSPSGPNETALSLIGECNLKPAPLAMSVQPLGSGDNNQGKDSSRLHAQTPLQKPGPSSENSHKCEEGLSNKKGIKGTVHTPSTSDGLDLEHDSNSEESEISENVITAVFKVGDHVSAVYQNKWYIGIIHQDPSPVAVEIQFMEPKGTNRFEWPEKLDIHAVPRCDILCKVSPPVPVTSRHVGLTKQDLIITEKKMKEWNYAML